MPGDRLPFKPVTANAAWPWYLEGSEIKWAPSSWRGIPVHRMFLTSVPSFQQSEAGGDENEYVTSHCALMVQDRLDTARTAISA